MAVQKTLTPVQQQMPPGGKDLRVHTRFRVLLNAALVTTTDEQTVKIRDISVGGVMLEGLRPITRNKDVILRRGGTELFARVAWSDDKRCGLEFDDVLTQAEMLDFVQQPMKVSTFVPPPHLGRPTIEREPLTADQWAMVQAWGQPIGRQLFGE